MAATAAINTPERPGVLLYLPLTAAVKIWAGTLIALDASGNVKPAADAAGLRVVAVSQETADNTSGAAGDAKVNAKRGIFRFANSATDAVDANDKGKLCFVEDDKTVCEAGGTYKVIAGRIIDVDSDGVWVEVGRESLVVPTQVTLTSTNGTAAAASASLANLAAEAEKIGDDTRAIHAALVAAGILLP